MKLIGMISGSKSIKTINYYVNIVKKDITMKQRNSFRRDKMAIQSRSTGKDSMIGVHYTMPAMKAMMTLSPFCALMV